MGQKGVHMGGAESEHSYEQCYNNMYQVCKHNISIIDTSKQSRCLNNILPTLTLFTPQSGI